ncbi:hypothetical protein RHSIM_Rhsim09G0122100 [Rhododendron simsii]|uniref:18S pre-ribosomal assembly protein gar2-related n=1 Tax=Rhododendron simsii TaxID=118357 RepID=A0A834GKC5_RHOSS|nr:hypothetical protein RHSIM_Rhsim09G0122100 [Rhododendron simsii]
MKPDNDPLFCQSTLLRKHEAKPSANKNSALDTAKLEGIMMENQNGALCHHHNCDTDTARLASDKDGFCDTPDLECIMFVEDCTTGDGNAVRDAVAPCAIPSNQKELFQRDMEVHSDANGIQNELGFRESVAPCAIPSRKMGKFDTDPYTDKNVLECELPELLVCYKDNPFHVVKDICIDEGVPSKDKVSVECREENCLCTFLSSNENKYGGLTGREDNELLSSCGSKSSSENDSDEVYTSECRTKEIELLSPSGSKSSSEDDCQEVDTHVCGSNERVGTELLASLENGIAKDIGNDNGPTVPVQSQTDEANFNTTHEKVDEVSRAKFVTRRVNVPKSLKELLQMPLTEQPCETLSVILTPEESNKCNPASSLSYDSKVESGTITFDFNSLKPAASERDEIPNGSNLESHKNDSENKHDNGISDSLSVSSENQHYQGETSFSMATHPVSGLITYSGHIVSSGSISHRSDSSTTSIRSFAFPVLQNEWNSSPIRMAKADRRHCRRRRGWHGLFCCRF